VSQRPHAASGSGARPATPGPGLTPREPSAEQLQNWFGRAHGIVSSAGGQIEASDVQRKLALLFQDGTLLVERHNPTHPQVLAFREMARRKGLAVSTCYQVDIEILRQLYEEAQRQHRVATGASADADTEPMQREVLALLRDAVGLHASDVHVYVTAHEAEIKMRVRGEMVRMRQVDAKFGHELLAAAYNMSETADATYRLYDYQAGRISAIKTPLPDGLQAVRLQLNPLGSGGRYLICRLLYAQSRWEERLTLEALGLHPRQLRCFAQMRRIPEGVNIISGPTGSGKSTTLKIVLEELYLERKQQINILTIEDPPEYEIRGAAQLPVANVDNEEERGAAYRKAIVAALRSDPDVIMPGEARDREVINLVFTAAMTGHQVWTSLHANSAMAIFDRLRDQGVEEYKLNDPTLLTGLTAQRLAKQLCPHCSLPLDDAAIAAFGDALPGFAEAGEDHLHTIRQANPDGCEHCTHGYKGRTVLAEVICPDQTFLSLMACGDRQGALRHWTESLGGLTMMEHGWLHMIDGRIDPRDLVDRLGPMHGLTAARRATLLHLK